MSKRDELVRKLDEHHCPVCQQCHIIEAMDNYVKDRERTLLREVLEPLETYDISRNNWGSKHPSCEQVCQMIDEAIAIIKKRLGEV